MSTTVPIPDEVVGDYATIKRRHDRIDGDVCAWADTLVDAVREGSSEAYCLRRLTEHVEQRRNIHAEYRRRTFVARDLMEADLGNPRHASYVRRGR